MSDVASEPAGEPAPAATGLAPGTRLPDLTLPDSDGHPRRLLDLPGGDPLVLHLHRGWFCPKDRTYLREVLLPFSRELAVAYARLVSVSVEPPPVQAAYRAGLDATWPFLADTERDLQAALGLREWTDTVHDPYVPTVAVVRPDGVVHETWNGYWYLGRPGADELRRSLRAVARGVRPDWNVPGPGDGRG